MKLKVDNWSKGDNEKSLKENCFEWVLFYN